MPEVPLDFPRAWVEFVDPADPDQVVRADLTWLTSRWSCLFGSGRCPGIYAERPDDGCCTLGAHYSDAEDEKRVAKVARKLSAAQWQHKKDGKDGISEVDDEGSRKTRVVDGGCIFLNRRGFSGGAGCALHGYALSTGTSIVDTKPDVCWQLPIRRQFRDVERPDGSTYTEVTITEYERRGWGPGGHDLDWYCSGNSDAHIGPEPVYLSSRDELVALLGETAYAAVAAACASRIADQPRAVHQIAGHPATVLAEATAERAAKRQSRPAAQHPAEHTGSVPKPA